jgi:hypothetical protein
LESSERETSGSDQQEAAEGCRCKATRFTFDVAQARADDGPEPDE